MFALLPKLLERAGAAERGSITGIYTVLVEGDDMNDPVGDTARSILDGHVTLSRRLASAGHFPTVEVLDSVSRVAGAITTPRERELGVELRRLMAAYEESRDLIEIGAYREGSNPLVDRAIELKGAIDDFCRQPMAELVSAVDSWAAIEAVLS
jgi:flagellum-specific ATP synthase